MMFLTVIALILVSVAVSFVFYNHFSGVMRDELRDWIGVFQKADAATVKSELVDVNPSNMRVTLIGGDGTVEYDNTVGADNLDNHAGREEVAEALSTGSGESSRLSDTLGQETYYYAIRLADGDVLRASKTRSSILGMFSKAIPAVIIVILIVLIVGYFLAKNLTKRIVAPINNVNLKGSEAGDLTPPYDELTPFVRMIEQQREQIAIQFDDLKRRTDTINAIMDNMREGIIFVDSRGMIASINNSAESILEIDRTAEGSGILEAIRDIDLLNNVREALAGSRKEVVKEYGGRTYRVFISPVAEGGAIILLLDVTEKAMGEKLRREFSANVSHELKTPLTSIYGYAEMLYNGMIEKSEVDTLLGKIKDEAQRMNTLIQDIITVSKLDEGGAADAFEEVDLCAVAGEASEALALSAKENNIAVSISCGADAGQRQTSKGQPSDHTKITHTHPHFPRRSLIDGVDYDGQLYKGDRSMMYELFFNLIDNAIKYNKPGGEVNVDIRSGADGHIEITVSDTGIGIPKKSQSRVFERFYRVDKSRSKKKGGTGLGLAIVKHIVMIHDGQVSLESRENEGTTISVRF
jgi:two-component system phosphate regulon sensor histidine kinase PhoR